MTPRRVLTLTAAACLSLSAITADAATPSCEVGGLTLAPAQVRYVTGAHGVDGSIYARCEATSPTTVAAKCYVDTRLRDHTQGTAIPCDDATIHASRRQLGIYLSASNNYWPGGVACYQHLSPSPFSAEQQGVFQRAMDEFHTKTTARFIPLSECAAKYGTSKPEVCGGCTQAFTFVSGEGPSDCSATLGYAANTPMKLNFGPACFNGDGGFSVAVHELGHILGLIHEHTHPDRAVVVLRNALTLGSENYIKTQNGLSTAYDPMSIMHYARETGLCIPRDRTKNYCDVTQSSAEGCVEPTIDMCDSSLDNSFGRARELSAQDVATVARIYGSGGGPVPTPAPTTPSTQTPVPTPPPQPSTPTTPSPSTNAPTVTPVPVPTSGSPDQQNPVPATSPSQPTVTPAPAPAPTSGSPDQNPAVATPAPSATPSVTPPSPPAATTTSPTPAATTNAPPYAIPDGGSAINSYEQSSVGSESKREDRASPAPPTPEDHFCE